jgi:LPXTG-motif cell wall-anchored protein
MVTGGFGVQETTFAVRPSSCTIAPEYPVVLHNIQYVGSASGNWYHNPPYTVSFADMSKAPAGQPLQSWYWNFGDGATSTSQNPVHAYDKPGTYNVLQSVTTVCGSDYTKKVSFTVTVDCSLPAGGFITDVTEGAVPLTVHITDTSLQTPPEWTIWRYEYQNTDGEAPIRYMHKKDGEIFLTEPGTYRITQYISKYRTTARDSSLMAKSSPVSKNIRVYLAGIGVSPSSSVIPGAEFGPRYSYLPVTTTPASTTVATATTMPSSTDPGTVTGSGAAPVSSPAAGSAPPAPGTGTLSIVTNPAGASVYVDEVKWGVSPATIPGIAAGTHTLRLEKAGYQNLSVPVTVTDGKTAEYSLALEPAAGSSNGMLPLIAGAVVILALAGSGVYLYTKRKKSP